MNNSHILSKRAEIAQNIVKSYNNAPVAESNENDLNDESKWGFTNEDLEKAVTDHFEKGGKAAVMGEKRMFGGREYIKTAGGWKFSGKGGGAKAQEHAATHAPKKEESNSDKNDHLSFYKKEVDEAKRLVENSSGKGLADAQKKLKDAERTLKREEGKLKKKDTTKTSKDYSDKELTKIAKACHEANKELCESLGDHSQKSWEDAEEWQRQATIDGVKFRIDNPNAGLDESHKTWSESLKKDGWKYGPVKDHKKKEHPLLVPFDKLPKEKRELDLKKNKKFFDVVDSMK